MSAQGGSGHFSLFRFLDRFLGGLACAAVSPLIHLMRLLAEGGLPRPRKILVIKFFGLGSILRGWPLFEAIRRAHPSAELHLLTFSSNTGIARRMGSFTRILDVDSSGPLRLLHDMFRRIGQIAVGRYDIVIDMEFFSNFATLLTALTRAPVRVGYYLRLGFREGILNRIVPYNPARHITEVYAALGRAIGVESSAEAPRLRASEEDRGRLGELLSRRGIPPHAPIAVFGVTSSGLCDERAWPADCYAWLNDRLLSERPVRIAYVGSVRERPMVDAVLGSCRRKDGLNLAGETDLGMLVALLERSSLVVAHDSGPAHLADVVGAPLLALFGPESPDHYGPLGPRSAAFHAGLYCSPCLSAANTKVAPCGGRNACMQAIRREDVLEAAGRLLDGLPIPVERRAFWRGYGGRHSNEDWKTLRPA